ncbi:MAG TPA: BTAD domain-containing putative transcriptional regulator [Pseudonocardia sp.]|nr:BTAD domain-containing putative transcriptional regulator [Pseudonocardia sp.]
MRVRVLGTLELVDATEQTGVPLRSARLRRLLVALLVHAGDVVPADRLVHAVWGDALPVDPVNSLQILVSRLRRALGPGPALHTRAPGYLLDPGGSDADRFQRLLAEARQPGLPPEQAAQRLDEALALWRGPAYAEFADEDFVRAEAVRLEELRLEAAEERIDLALRRGRTDEAITRLEPLVAAHPLRERLRGQAVLALYRAGRQAEALAHYTGYRRELAEELGVDPSPPLQELYAQVLRHDPVIAQPQRPEPEPAPGNLPAPMTELIGRDADLAGVAAALRRSRVVTLTGPGGVGKTRLALAAAAHAAAGFVDGAWLVDLGAVTRPESVPGAVVTALGVQRRQELSVGQRLVEYLRPLRLLLVLDNCEHLAGAAARLVQAIAAGCTEVTVLATSREPLAADGERVYPVAPLPVPPPGLSEPGAVAAVPAVRLFVDRATAASPGFVLDPAGAAAVAELCRRLDGLPLALELAAAKLRALRPAELVSRLDGRFGLLGGGRRAAPERHRTLRAVVDWSYELLDEPEREVFERLSVFPSAFTLTAAEAVCGADAPVDVAAAVAGLVDRSMVSADATGEPTRYALLETMRAYGRERLAVRGAEAAARRAHAHHVLATAETADAGLRGAEEARWVEELVRTVDDLRTANTWAIEHDHGLAVRLSAALVWFARFHLPPEVPLWAEQTAETVQRHPGDRFARMPAVLGVAAAAARGRGDHARAAELADRGLHAGDGPDDPDLRYPLMVRSGLALFHGELDAADRLAARAAELSLHCDDPSWGAHAIANRSLAATYRGDPATARRLADEAAALAGTTGNPTATGWACYASGEALTGADPDRAIELLERSRTLAASVRNRYLGGVALVSAAALRGRHGDPLAALRLFAEVIEHWHRSGNWTQQWTTVRNVVEILVKLRADEPAAVLDAAVASRRTAAPAYGAVAERLDRARWVLRERLGAARFGAAAARGAGMSDDEVIALARGVLTEVTGHGWPPVPRTVPSGYR